MDNRHCESIRRDLMPYALQTLSAARHQAVQMHLAGCEACRAALEAERKRLRLLEGLDEPAPEGLADRALGGALIASWERKPRRSPQWSFSILLAVACISLPVLLFISSLWRGHLAWESKQNRAATQNNLKQLGLVFKMYANESEGERYPALLPGEDIWVPDLSLLMPEYISEPQSLVSRHNPSWKKIERKLREEPENSVPDIAKLEVIMGDNFAYLGYATSTEAELETVLRAKDANRIPTDDTAISDAEAGTTVQPLREGVERFLITDINNPGASSKAQSTIPVVIEIAGWRYKKSVEDYEGASVLYMDGHVEFVRLGTFPVLPWVLDTLCGIQPTRRE